MTSVEIDQGMTYFGYREALELVYAHVPVVSARLTKDMNSRHRNWTEFRDAMLDKDTGGAYTVTPYLERSRLQAIARAHCLVCIPEGVDSLNRGDRVPVQVLMPSFGGLSPARERTGTALPAPQRLLP